MDTHIDQALLDEMRSAGLIDDTVLASITTTTTVETMALPIGSVETIETTEIVDHTELAREIEREEDREAMYADQESETVILDAEGEGAPIVTLEAPTPETVGKAPRKARAAKPEGSTPAKRVSRVTIAGSMGDYVEKLAGPTLQLTEAISEPTSALVNGLPKKIQEKAANVADFLFAGKRLSIFSKIAVETLKTEGAISGKRLVELYQGNAAKAYSIGTARSQSQQLVALMKKLAVITTDGKLNNDSTLWPRLAA